MDKKSDALTKTFKKNFEKSAFYPKPFRFQCV